MKHPNSGLRRFLGAVLRKPVATGVLGVAWLGAMGESTGSALLGRAAATIVTAEENAVYRAIAELHYKHPAGAPFFLEPMTVVPFSTYEDRNATRLRNQSDSALYEEYRRRSAERVSISDRAGIPGAVHFPDSAPPGIADSLRQRASGIGIHAFSRVGFSNAGDRALVYAFRRCGTLCGDGGLFFLEKRSERWLIVRRLYVTAS